MAQRRTGSWLWFVAAVCLITGAMLWAVYGDNLRQLFGARVDYVTYAPPEAPHRPRLHKTLKEFRSPSESESAPAP